jgi:hypothetical protein
MSDASDLFRLEKLLAALATIRISDSQAKLIFLLSTFRPVDMSRLMETDQMPEIFWSRMSLLRRALRPLGYVIEKTADKRGYQLKEITVETDVVTVARRR